MLRSGGSDKVEEQLGNWRYSPTQLRRRPTKVVNLENVLMHSLRVQRNNFRYISATFGRGVQFDNAYNTVDGAILAMDNRNEAADPNQPKKHWSDLVFAIWKDLCKTDENKFRGLKYVIRTEITNETTQKLIRHLLHNSPEEKGLKSGQFEPNADGFYGMLGVHIYNRNSLDGTNQALIALLQSPNGIGVCYLAIDHPRLFSDKKVAQIGVYQYEGIYFMVLVLGKPIRQ